MISKNYIGMFSFLISFWINFMTSQAEYKNTSAEMFCYSAGQFWLKIYESKKVAQVVSFPKKNYRIFIFLFPHLHS